MTNWEKIFVKSGKRLIVLIYKVFIKAIKNISQNSETYFHKEHRSWHFVLTTCKKLNKLINQQLFLDPSVK